MKTTFFATANRWMRKSIQNLPYFIVIGNVVVQAPFNPYMAFTILPRSGGVRGGVKLQWHNPLLTSPNLGKEFDATHLILPSLGEGIK